MDRRVTAKIENLRTLPIYILSAKHGWHFNVDDYGLQLLVVKLLIWFDTLLFQGQWFTTMCWVVMIHASFGLRMLYLAAQHVAYMDINRIFKKSRQRTKNGK